MFAYLLLESATKPSHSDCDSFASSSSAGRQMCKPNGNIPFVLTQSRSFFFFSLLQMFTSFVDLTMFMRLCAHAQMCVASFTSFHDSLFTMMPTLYRSQEPFEIEGYRVRGTTPSKTRMPSRRKRPPEVKDNEKALEGTRNSVLHRKRSINLYSCSKLRDTFQE